MKRRLGMVEAIALGSAMAGGFLASGTLEVLAQEAGSSDAPTVSVADPDADGDGITDPWEMLFKTDPAKSDSDGDGFSDAVEVRNAFSAIDKRSIPGSYADTDRDGLDDRLEWLFKTDPYNPDTDADGNVDGREIASAFSPTSTATSTLQKRLRVVLSTQRMERHLGGVLLDRHAISSGLPKTPTPVGEFKILNKNRRAWSKSAKLWMPWWMGISTRGYGLHELPEWPGGLKEGAAHLGRMASHGCVRMGEGVAKMVYDWTPIGTPVSIVKK